jgi:hypothetical protein
VIFPEGRESRNARLPPYGALWTIGAAPAT